MKRRDKEEEGREEKKKGGVEEKKRNTVCTILIPRSIHRGRKDGFTKIEDRGARTRRREEAFSLSLSSLTVLFSIHRNIR